MDTPFYFNEHPSRRQSEFSIIIDQDDNSSSDEETRQGCEKFDKLMMRHQFTKAGSTKAETSETTVNKRNPYTDLRFNVINPEIFSPSEEIDPLECTQVIKELSSNFFNRCINADYDIEDDGFLGQGAFATVRKGISKKTGEPFAIKCIDKNILMTEYEFAALNRELCIHSKLKHKNICTLNAVYNCGNMIYLVLPYADMSLEDYMAGKLCLPEKEAKCIIYQVLQALDYLHKNDIGHGDIKPSNILLFKDKTKDPNNCLSLTVKLCDFGLSILNANMTHPTRALKVTSIYGSSGFISPEMTVTNRLSCRGDIWAAGIVLYIILVGYHPFYPCYSKSSVLEFDPRDCENLSEDAKNIVRLMLTVDYKQRPSAEALLRKKWFREIMKMNLTRK
ncbi:hypothetical protein WA158_002013 [Blastocystis sp. Blastoise]